MRAWLCLCLMYLAPNWRERWQTEHYCLYEHSSGRCSSLSILTYTRHSGAAQVFFSLSDVNCHTRSDLCAGSVLEHVQGAKVSLKWQNYNKWEIQYSLFQSRSSLGLSPQKKKLSDRSRLPWSSLRTRLLTRGLWLDSTEDGLLAVH